MAPVGNGVGRPISAGDKFISINQLKDGAGENLTPPSSVFIGSIFGALRGA